MHAADQRHPARAVLVGQHAGEGLADAPGDLLHRDGEREVGDGDAEFLATAGAWNRPRFCRMPMARVIISAAPPSMA